MRWLIGLAGLVLAGCSSAVYDPPPVYAPEPLKTVEWAKIAANQAKMVGLVEVSTLRQAHPSAPGSHILCIRGTSQNTSVRIFSVFLNNSEFVQVRTPVLLDDCEAQLFTPLGTAPFPEAVKPPPSRF